MPDMFTNPAMFLKDPSNLQSGEDPFDYNVFQKAISDISAQTRTVGGPDTGGFSEAVEREFPRETSLERSQLDAALASYRTQEQSMRQEAGKAGTALDIMGATTEASMRRLQELQVEAYGRRETATEAWGAAAEKAGEYVQSAELRTQQALNRLDEINTGISEGRDFAKAHAMQAAVQGVIGTMSELEDQTIQKYGVDSKEYQQFQVRKSQTLATAQSQIETSYRQLQEQQSLTYMNANNELQWKEDMYASFQEQQHVETLRYLAQANDTYDMQLSQFGLAVEQMRGTTMENMANWIVQTPVFSMDIMPLFTFLGELVATRKADEATERQEFLDTHQWLPTNQYIPSRGTWSGPPGEIPEDLKRG